MTIAGIKINLDISWFLIAILISWTLALGYFPFYYPNLTVVTYWMMGIVGMLGLFISVLLHELSHATVAKGYGLPISGITLFIFGGVAEIQKEPPSPKIEFHVAIVGPIASIIIAILMYLITLFGEHAHWPTPLIGITSYLAFINAVIVIFNLIPAFPLDGGRIFRALLWKWKNNLGWATKIASNIGASFGIILMIGGGIFFIFGNMITGIWWFILGMFLRQAAIMSKRQFLIQKELKGETVDHFMQKDQVIIPADISVQNLVEDHFYRQFHDLYPVVENNQVLGFVTLEEIKQIPKSEWGQRKVKDILVPCTPQNTVTSSTSALQALKMMTPLDKPILMVVDNGNLSGTLTLEDLLRLISVKLELDQ